MRKGDKKKEIKKLDEYDGGIKMKGSVIKKVRRKTII